MIRLATHDDTYLVTRLLKQFLSETSYDLAEQAGNDLEHLCKLTWLTLQHGYIWLAFDRDQPVGLLMAIREPNMWLPKAHELREIVWFVVAEYRQHSLGGKLFLNYCKKGEELLKTGAIKGYFTTRMTTTDTIDYERRGFRKTEETFLKE